MTETQTRKTSNQLNSQKSIPEHIIDGSIGIDSIEAFGSILKQFPTIERPQNPGGGDPV